MPALSSPTYYGTLTGQLFLYATGRAAFESSSSLLELTPNKCILLGGLSDGLLPVPYTKDLEQVCFETNWSLVQPILSSSYTGFGHGSLDRDVQEIDELMEYLISNRKAESFCLVGHSTGCQDAVHFLQHGRHANRMRFVVLQAPVSDREGAMEKTEEYAKNLAQAQAMKDEGQLDEMMPRSAFWAPITAQRFLDLQERGGRDDYFSSDFSDDELRDRLQHVGKNQNRKVLVAFSGADEYVAKHVDAVELTNRLVRAMNTLNDVAIPLYLPTGNHNLSQCDEDSKMFVGKIKDLLQQAKVK